MTAILGTGMIPVVGGRSYGYLMSIGLPGTLGDATK